MLAITFALLLASAPTAAEQSQKHVREGDTADCLRVLSPLAEGDVPAAARFEPVPCSGTIIARAFRYDRSERATRVARTLTIGNVVKRYPEYGARAVAPGQILRLVVSEDVVRVERQVEALQEARPGQKLFVRSRDGEILSVRYEAGVP